MTDPAGPETRILICAESASDARAALRFARALAGDRPAVFGGLLVIDEALRGPPALSCQRVVTLSGALAMLPSHAQLRVIAESESRAFREMLAAAAAGIRARWSVETRSGHLGPMLAELARNWDLLVVGHRPLHRWQGTVALLTGDSSPASEARAVARHLAEALKTEVTELFQPGGAAVEPAALAQRINRLNAAVVVVDPAVPQLPSLRHVLALIGEARCPIVVLRAGSFAPLVEHATQIPPRDPRLP